MIFDMLAKHGPSWRKIVAHLPGRTVASVRNRWQRIEKGRRLREEGQPMKNVASTPPRRPLVRTRFSVAPHLAPRPPPHSWQRCAQCGQPKRGHVCLARLKQPPEAGSPSMAPSGGVPLHLAADPGAPMDPIGGGVAERSHAATFGLTVATHALGPAAIPLPCDLPHYADLEGMPAGPAESEEASLLHSFSVRVHRAASIEIEQKVSPGSAAAEAEADVGAAACLLEYQGSPRYGPPSREPSASASHAGGAAAAAATLVAPVRGTSTASWAGLLDCLHQPSPLVDLSRSASERSRGSARPSRQPSGAAPPATRSMAPLVPEYAAAGWETGGAAGWRGRGRGCRAGGPA